MLYRFNNFNVFDATLEIHNRSIYYAGEVIELQSLVTDLVDELHYIANIIASDGYTNVLKEYLDKVWNFLDEAVDTLEFFTSVYGFEGCDRATIMKALWKEMENKIEFVCVGVIRQDLNE